MSGRNYRDFVTNHRTDVAERLAHRASLGIPVNNFKPLDYEQIKAFAVKKKFEGFKHELKLQKIESLRKKGKENNLLKQQHLVWDREVIRLNKLRKKIEREMIQCMDENSTSGPAVEAFQELEYVQAGLDNTYEHFKTSTVVPIFNLKEDLQYWLEENMEELRNGSPDALSKHAEIKEVAESVKHQQTEVMKSLDEEAAILEQELRSGYLGELTAAQLDHHCPPLSVAKGIPEEALELPCPDDQLKASILQEFIELDNKYEAQLKLLDVKHAKAVHSDEYGGWTEEDNFIFVTVCDQYPSDIANRRTLLMDRLRRHLPNKTRAELVEHEDWWMDYKYYCECRRNISSDWKRARSELLVKTRLAFEDACIEQEQESMRQKNRILREQHRYALFEKVRGWREQKTQALQLEMKLEEAAQALRMEKYRQELEKEQNRRQEQKKMISAFHAEREKKHLAELADIQRYLDELKRNLEEQAVHDRERVQFRAVELEKKYEAQRMKREQEMEEEQERERRLEALREEVRISAESDPVRMMGNTEAWRHRQENNEEEYVALQKPLFEVNSFTSSQITCDPRFRLEQRLREAGLHTSEYARNVMAAVKPPRNPRPDQASDIFHQREGNP